MLMPVSYSLRSLFARKSTSVAAALGIALVVFVFASSLMLSRGVRRTFVSAGSPDRAVVLRKGAGAELTSGVDSPTASLVLSTPGVKREAGQPLGTPELVVVVLMDKLGMEGKVANVQLRGVTETSWRLRPEVRIVEGRAPRPGTDEVAVGRALRGRFRGLELGGRFEIKKNRWAQVVGILGAGGSGLDSEIWVDLDTLRSTFGRAGLASSVLVRLDNASAYDAFRANVEHDKRLGLEVFREPAYYDKQSEGTRVFVTALGSVVTFFFSFGAMIGATITMYAAVAQRRREIGTLRALGFSRLAVSVSFVVEAVALATVGGALGAVASLAMGAVSFSMMNFATWQEVTFSFDPSLGVLVTATTVGAVMGVLGGLLPALSAAFTPPAAAMRS